MQKNELNGTYLVENIDQIKNTFAIEKEKIDLENGLECADSVNDKSITCFARGTMPAFAGINTFLRAPYLEDVREVGKADVAILGVPYDSGACYRGGARFGPQGIRKISGLYTSYSLDLGIELRDSISMVDVGDVYTISGNNDKNQDQITKAVGHIAKAGTFPVILGGDHSITFPCIRGIAENANGNIGIIYIDSHGDSFEKMMDERMHGCSCYHVCNLPNVKAKNLVQIGLHGWANMIEFMQFAKEKGSTVFTIADIERFGVEEVAKKALEIAWDGVDQVYLSVDIDCLEASAVPGTGAPEVGGLTPRELMRLLRIVCERGLCGMDIVEVAPEYDHSDVTSLMASRIVLEVLGSLVYNKKL